MGSDLTSDAQRLKLALDLFTAGEEVMRQKLRRQHADLTDAQIETLVRQWLQERPGAEYGDAPGLPIAWPRPAS